LKNKIKTKSITVFQIIKYIKFGWFRLFDTFSFFLLEINFIFQNKIGPQSGLKLNLKHKLAYLFGNMCHLYWPGNQFVRQRQLTLFGVF
jgi:hypothetical protein